MAGQLLLKFITKIHTLNKLNAVIFIPKKLLSILLFTCLCLASLAVVAQGINRPPAVAGAYYAADAAELQEQVKELLKNSDVKRYDNARGVICPHAGYRHSGDIAAKSIYQLDPNKDYDRIFILAVSHTSAYSGVSIYNLGNYETPLGTVEVDQELCNEFMNKYSAFDFNPEAHILEHSIEAILPMLQVHLKKDFKIVPLLIGAKTPVLTLSEVARIIKPYFTDENFFIVSTDLSHYPNYEGAQKADRNMIEAIKTNSISNLITAIKENSGALIPNLSTSACGGKAVITFMNLTLHNKNLEFIELASKNSGDVEGGSKESVVGYTSMVLTGKYDEKAEKPQFELNDDEKIELLQQARKTIKYYLNRGVAPDVASSAKLDKLNTKAGVFVTLTKGKELRGCIGHFDADQPLYQIVDKMAIAAAVEDPRFQPLKTNEMPQIDIEISVLTPMRKIESIEEIELGKHGIYITKGDQGGTFLPQVALETGWSLEEFLGHCAQDKAGIGWEGWRDAEIYVYEALVFSEHQFEIEMRIGN